MSLVRRITWQLVMAILLLPAVPPAQDLSKSSTYPEIRVIAGSDSDFMMVRHVVLRGSNFEIGQQMASFAQSNGISITPAQDSTVNKLRRNYLKEVYPAYFERMKGLAERFGQSIENNKWDFSMLWQPMVIGMGCSMVYCPKQTTDSGHGMLCRNYDFTTGTISGQLPDSGFLPVNSRPILFEIHPADGYASLAMCDFELLGGVLDGINSEGLMVAIAADDETIGQYGRQTGNEVGLHELLCMRYLLDNCANVQEAKEAMLTLKHFYAFIPCHYLVADRNGQSFIFEFSSQRNQSHITDGCGPQIMTNHPVFSYANAADLPKGWSYDRFRILRDALAEKNRYNASDLVAALSKVQPVSPVSENSLYAPLRTLWNAIYDSEELTLTIKFYLGETRTDDGESVMKYSEPLMIRLIKPAQDDRSGIFTDPRDGNVYKWVKIGNQIWMAENLRFKPDSGSWCWENLEQNCMTKGRLYDWKTAKQVSPPGWHLPSDKEWKELEIALGLTAEQADQEGMRIDKDSLLAGKIKLRDAWPGEYKGKPLTITNETGFSAVITGFFANNEFTHDGYTSWWSSTDHETKAWLRHIGFFDNFIGRVLNPKVFAFAVRCIKDHDDPSNSTDK
jgi:uncharacterized protein (TIGR02145 family)